MDGQFTLPGDPKDNAPRHMAWGISYESRMKLVPARRDYFDAALDFAFPSKAPTSPANAMSSMTKPAAAIVSAIGGFQEQQRVAARKAAEGGRIEAYLIRELGLWDLEAGGREKWKRARLDFILVVGRLTKLS
jgi:hypothetical protein